MAKLLHQHWCSFPNHAGKCNCDREQTAERAAPGTDVRSFCELVANVGPLPTTALTAPAEPETDAELLARHGLNKVHMHQARALPCAEKGHHGGNPLVCDVADRHRYFATLLTLLPADSTGPVGDARRLLAMVLR